MPSWFYTKYEFKTLRTFNIQLFKTSATYQNLSSATIKIVELWGWYAYFCSSYSFSWYRERSCLFMYFFQKPGLWRALESRIRWPDPRPTKLPETPSSSFRKVASGRVWIPASKVARCSLLFFIGPLPIWCPIRSNIYEYCRGVVTSLSS